MNKNILSNFLMFAVGATVGSVVTWKLVKTKYEQIAQEEIESVREVYENVAEALTGYDKTDDEDEDTDDYDEYDRIIRGANYDGQNENKEEEDDMGPHVVAYDEFAEIGYDTETYYYFKDGVVTDTMYNVIVDADEQLGEDFADHFGEEEEDSVYIRNDKLRKDIEVIRDERSFSEVDGTQCGYL